jgi:hypothetical protein
MWDIDDNTQEDPMVLSAEANTLNDFLSQPCLSDPCTVSFGNVINHTLQLALERTYVSCVVTVNGLQLP